MSLRCMTVAVTLPLPGLSGAATGAGKAVTGLLQVRGWCCALAGTRLDTIFAHFVTPDQNCPRLPAARAPCTTDPSFALSRVQKLPSVKHVLSQDCFRLLAGLLRACAEYQPSTAQLRFLLT